VAKGSSTIKVEILRNWPQQFTSKKHNDQASSYLTLNKCLLGGNPVISIFVLFSFVVFNLVVDAS